MIPGDPIQTFIQTLQQNYVYNAQASAEVIAKYRAEFGLDGNMFTQYFRYMYQVLVQQRPRAVADQLPDARPRTSSCRALPWTIGLLGISAVLAWIIGLLIGAIAGWRRGQARSRRSRRTCRSRCRTCPYFFLALILVFVFAYQLSCSRPGRPMTRDSNPA